MTTVEQHDGTDPALRRARWATLASLFAAWLASLTMPVLAVREETSGLWVLLGVVGVCVFACALGGGLYAAATPWLSDRTRRTLLAAFGGAAVLTVPLLAPVGGPDWETWAWVGGAAAGFTPVLLRRRAAVLASAAVLAVALAVAVVLGGVVWAYAVITVSVGAGVALMSSLPVWLWGLLVQARAARAAQARLAVTEERLRFARDVHDVLGHRLAVISLKAELAARLAPSDADRSAKESLEVQRLATAALDDVRDAIHGYRVVDLDDQLAAVTKVLTSSGVRCAVNQTAGDLPDDVATQLALLLREAGTNVLRHSRASWCTVDIARVKVGGSVGRDRTVAGEVTMTVANDGATGGRGDSRSYGLSGAADRLADAGGTLRAVERDGVFMLAATLPMA